MKRVKVDTKTCQLSTLYRFFNSSFNIKLVKVGTKFHIIISSDLSLCTKNIFDILIYFLFIFPHTRLSRLSTNLHFVIYRENNLYPWVSTSYIITGIQSRYTYTKRIIYIYLSYYLHSRTHYVRWWTQYLTKWVQIITCTFEIMSFNYFQDIIIKSKKESLSPTPLSFLGNNQWALRWVMVARYSPYI